MTAATPTGPSQATVLVELARAASLFHASDNTAFGDLRINGHRETWPVRSRGFRQWLGRAYFEERKAAPAAESLNSALATIEAFAHFDGPERKTHVRSATYDGRLYLDLCDDAWRAVEVDANGWRVISEPPVRFRRYPGMRALPPPLTGGSVERLRPFLNVVTDRDFVLAVSWLLAALRADGPFPALGLSGEQGSAKSTFAAILRALVDPNTAPLRAMPRDERDLFIAANNAHVLAFDNVSRLPDWLSDALCRLATGGGFATRALHTNDEERLFDACRPIILNGIEDIVARPDLADRSILITLAPIADSARRSAADLLAEFDAEMPYILGALLTVVAGGIRALPETRLRSLPRMADFARWATACEGGLWAPGTFIAAYASNRNEAVQVTIDADLVATAVRTWMIDRQEWTGTATELSAELSDVMNDGWGAPKTPAALSAKLRRLAPALRKIGINISDHRQGHGGTRTLRITKSPPTAAETTD